MRTEEQTPIETRLPAKQHNTRDTPASQHPLTWKQLRLAKFISEENVAEFEAVVTAMQNRQYNRVDQWKTEAGIRAAAPPPKLDPRIAECLARQKARLEGRREYDKHD
jgi:hypothetical protein